MPQRILVVEDDTEAAETVREILVSAGYEVPPAVPSGSRAIAEAEKVQPQLVLMDVRLDGPMDGIDTARVLRERFGVPIVYLTGHIDDATFGRAKETSPLGYVKKPFTQHDLRIAVEIALHHAALEQALAARERWFALTLRSIVDAVVVTDATERVTFVNPAAETLLAIRNEDAASRSVEEVLRALGTAAPQVLTFIRAAIAIHASTTIHGGKFPIEGTVAPLTKDDGDSGGSVMVFRDVSERRRLEARLATTERLAAIGTMVAGMQHEINNPLATVIANLQYVSDAMAERAADDEVIQEVVAALSDARDGAARVKKVIQDLRHFSRAEDVARGPVDIVQALESAAKVTAHAVRHHATLRRSYAAAPHVLATDAQLTRVFVNLLLTAAQATGDGRAEQHVIVLTTRTDAKGYAIAEITHDGPPLSRQDIAHVFDPVPGSESLALAICQGIVASLGGEIEVESSAEQPSTTFRVVLPPAPRPTANTTTPASQKTRSAPRKAGASGARILIVDDEPAIGSALRRLLGREHEIVFEGDGRAALDLLAKESFDVVFCDLMMPRMSGMEFFEALSASAPKQAQRVIFLTGGAFSPRSEEFLKSVANRCLSKPFDRETVAAAVKAMLR